MRITARVRLLLILLAAVLLVAAVVLVVVKPQGREPAPFGCQEVASPVYQSVDLSNGATTLTDDQASYRAALGEGQFDRGIPFAAAVHAGTGLQAVRLLVNRENGDRMYVADPSTLASARSGRGVVDQGIAFYVPTAASPCASPVYVLTKDGRHQYAASGNVVADLAGEGWQRTGTAFLADTNRSAAPVPVTEVDANPAVGVGPGQFTLVAIPDTQQEVISPADTRLADRMTWLVRNKDKMNLQFVVHVGDLVNWDTPDHGQYVQATSALQILSKAKIRYVLTPGNHDAAATCSGGAACPGVDVRKALRDTATLNRFFPDPAAAAAGEQFERGKIDNSFHVFRAEGHSFLVLNLELWPRRSVLAWARSVIASHPQDNVILLTHYYLTATGVISTADDYGDTSPAEVDRELVQPFSNVKLVISGHVGTGAIYVGRNGGGKVAYIMQTFHSNDTNPTRLLQIDVARGSIKAQVYSPSRDWVYPQMAETITGIRFV